MGRDCLLLSGEVATIDARVAESFSIFQWILQKHGLTPSYGPGKTAVLISYRGKKSAPLHRRRFAQSDPCIPCVVERGHSVSLCVVLTSPWAASSMVTLYFLRSRPVWPWQCKQSNHCQNIVLANVKIALKRRQQILASLGTSVLVHNIGTSRRLNEQEFTSAVWKLYGCMFRGDPLADFQRRSIEHVTLAAGGFLPLALLHVSRLRLSCLSVFFVLLMICSLLQLRQTTKLAGKTRIILGTVVSFVLWIGFTPRLGHSPLTTTLDAFDQASWFLHTLRLPRTCSWHCGGLCRRTNLLLLF